MTRRDRFVEDRGDGKEPKQVRQSTFFDPKDGSVQSLKRYVYSKASRHRLFEKLESRQLLAADPALLFDVTSSPPSQGSVLIAWAVPLDGISSAHFFLATVNDQVQWWSTDGTTSGTHLIESIANPNHQDCTATFRLPRGCTATGGIPNHLAESVSY